jgi:hypothetical protein
MIAYRWKDMQWDADIGLSFIRCVSDKTLSVASIFSIPYSSGCATSAGSSHEKDQHH